MQKRRLILIVSSLLGFQTPLMAFTDGPAQVQRHTQFVEQMRHWAEQLKQYEEQVKTAKQELKALTGVKDIQNVLSEVENLKSNFESLSKEITDVNGLLDQGFDGLDPKTRKIFEKNGIGNSCQNRDDQLRKLCEGQIAFNIGNTNAQEKMVKEVSQTVNKLGRLAEGAKNAKDAKEALDYSNQINATLAMLQAQEMQNNLRRKNEEKMEKILIKKDEEIYLQKQKDSLERIKNKPFKD